MTLSEVLDRCRKLLTIDLGEDTDDGLAVVS